MPLSLTELKELAKGLNKSIAESQWRVSCKLDWPLCEHVLDADGRRSYDRASRRSSRT